MELLKNVLAPFRKGFLTDPGDKFTAEVTSKGLQVIKTSIRGLKRSLVRYPSTGTVVETRVWK